MSYIITIKFDDGRIERDTKIGTLEALQDAAYDAGALGVTAMVAQ